MLHIYKKIEKNIDNPYGIIEIKDIHELNKPFLFCMTPQDVVDKSVFGVIKEGARAARIRTSDEYAGGFKIEEVPVDFLGIKYEIKDIKDQKSDSIANDFMYQMFKDKSIEEMKKQARKMNFMLYCDAVRVYYQMEKRLYQKLLDDGINENDIKDILSQIGVIAIATEVDVSKLHSSVILFKDAQDREVFDKISRFSLKKMDELGRNAYISRITNNVLSYVYNGTGNHSLKEYFNDQTPVKSALSSVVSNLLENSIKNESSNKLIPISKDLLLPLLIRYNSEFMDGNQLLDKLDSELSYNGARKYTKEEHEILNKLNQIFRKLANTEKLLENKTKECNEERSKKDLLIYGIKDKCSDIAYHQIVIANGMNNGIKNEDIMNLPTDRQIRETYEQEKTRSL